MPTRSRRRARAGAPVLLALALPPAAAQEPGSVDTSPTPPPTATWPVLVDVAPSIGDAGTVFDDPGSGRGQAWVDVVGRDPNDPANPSAVGPPDGLLDLVQVNSNSPGLPLGAAGAYVTPPIGTDHYPCAVFRGKADGTFTEVAAQMSPLEPEGFNVEYPGGSPWGVVAADFDGDGDRDLFVPCGGFNTTSPNAMLSNEGDGTFRNRSSSAGILEVQPSFSAASLDYDLDGDLDLYVGNGPGNLPNFYVGPAGQDPTNRLHRNGGNGSFTEVGAQAKVDLKGRSFSVAATDLDRDGLPDLVVSSFKQLNKVFYNAGDGTFSLLAPPGSSKYQLDLATDLAPDPGDPDVLELAGVTPEMLAELPLLAKHSMPVHPADFNGDGWIDLFFSPWSSQLEDADPLSADGALFFPGEHSTLYLNLGDRDHDGRGDGLFREVSEEVGIAHVGGCMGQICADLNGDGWLDAYLGGGGPQVDKHLEEDYLYVAEGDAWPDDFQRDPYQPLTRVFYEVGALAGTYANKFMMHGSLARLSDEGRLDVMVGNGGPAVFDGGQTNVYWQNQGNADGSDPSYLPIELVATASPPRGVGARVEVVRDGSGGAGQVAVLERAAGYDFSSTDDSPLVFGLGAGGALFVNVRWPSGVRQGLALWPSTGDDSLVTLVEPDLSVALDASYPPAGGLDLAFAIENRGTTSAQGFTVLVALSEVGAAFAPTVIDVLDPLVALAPGESWSHAIPGVEELPPALLALLWVDGATGVLHGASAAWHEPTYEALAPWPGTPHAPPPHPPASGASSRTGGAPPAHLATGGGVVQLASTTELAAPWIEIAPARLPLEPERIATTGIGARELGAAGRISWADGVVTLERAPGVDATLSTLSGERIVVAGDVRGCCDASPDASPVWIRLGDPPAGAAADR